MKVSVFLSVFSSSFANYFSQVSLTREFVKSVVHSCSKLPCMTFLWSIHTYVCNINIPFPFMECVRLLACMMHCCSLVISNLGYGVFRQNKQNSFRVPDHKHTFYSTWNICNFGPYDLHTFDTMLSQTVAKACAHDSRWLSDYYEIKISASSWLWECTWISMLIHINIWM